MSPDQRPKPTGDQRTRQQTEADEAAAVRESMDTATIPVEETTDETVEPRSALEVQGDLPGIDDNSRIDNPPGWDKARDVADAHPVGADPEPQDEGHEGRHGAAAFRDGEPTGPEIGDVQVRPAGIKSTRDNGEDWDAVDEAVDESFPASDPPAKY